MPLNNMVPPQMGVDYDTLAQISRPQVPGIGLRASWGGLAQQNYNQEDQLRKGFLEKASGLADMDATLKQTAGQEWLDEAPGRAAIRERDTEQAINERDFARSPEGREARITKAIAEMSKADKTILESKAHIFAHLSKVSPDQVEGILDYYGDDAKFKGRDLKKLKPQQVIELAKGITLGLKETPKYGLEMDKNEKRNEGWVKREETRGKSLENVARIRANIAQTIAKLKSTTDKEIAELKRNPKTMDGLMSQIVQDLMEEGSSLTEAIAEVAPITEELKKRKAVDNPLEALLPPKKKEPAAKTPAASKPSGEKVNINGTIYDVIKKPDGEYVMHNGKERKIQR